MKYLHFRAIKLVLIDMFTLLITHLNQQFAN